MLFTMTTERRESRISYRYFFILVFVIPFVGSMCLAQTGATGPMYTATNLAKDGGAATPIPRVISHGFEDQRVDGNPITFIQYGLLPPNANIWKQWTFLNTSGIALDGSPITLFNTSAHEGTRVAFIEGQSSVTTSITVPPSTFRIHLKGAQRQRSSNPLVYDEQIVRVIVGGVQLAEFVFQGTTYQEYVTRPFVVSATASLSLKIEGVALGDNTALVDEIQFEKISEWNDDSSWTMGVPQRNQNVVIPNGVEIALASTGCLAGNLRVNGELLVGNRNSDLISDWVAVTGADALFEIGRKTTPFVEDFELTLAGALPAVSYLDAGNKFLLAQDGGSLNFHGQPRVSWVKLGDSINTGDYTLKLLSAVDWQPGDEIVIAGSNHQQLGTPTVNYVDYAEHMRIQSISAGTLITVDPSFNTNTVNGSFAHYHYGALTPATYSAQGQSWSLDERAEVGLLTRNIKIQGDLSSETTRFGGHMMVKRVTDSNSSGSAHLSNIELFRMGQKKKLARYPMHWHMMLGEATGQYIEDSSIHRSYNRAVTIHGTDFVRVENNVVYDTVGHAVFFEDGSEEDNEILGNLVMSTVKPAPGDQLLPSDNELDEIQNRTPASFWITNPNNIINNNVAAGTQGCGFWLIFPETPTGHSAEHTDAITYFNNRFPTKTNLGSFDGNVAHSCGMAFDVNDSIYFLNAFNDDHAINKNVAWQPVSGSAILTNFTCYANNSGIYAGNSDWDIRFDHAVCANNNENIRLAASHTIQNSLIVASTPNVQFGAGDRDGYVIYDGPGRLTNCHFESFNMLPGGVLSGGKGGRLHPNHLFNGLSFRSSSSALPKVHTDDRTIDVNKPGLTWGIAIRDVDGTFWGRSGKTITSNHPLMVVASSDLTPPNTAPNNFARLSPYRFGHLVYKTINGHVMNPPFPYVVRNANGAIPATQRFHGIGRSLPLIVESGFSYTFSWDNLGNADGLDITLGEVELGDEALLTFKDIARNHTLSFVPNIPSVTSMAALMSTTTTTYFIENNKDVHMRFVNVRGAESIRIDW